MTYLNNYFTRITICLSAVIFITGCQSPYVQYNPEKSGIKYQLMELDDPRPNRVHILRIDLSKEKIRPVVVIAEDPDGDGPAEAALTNPLKLAQHELVLAFINTNPWDSFPDATGKKNRSWFEGQPVDISGLSASNGSIRSPIKPGGVAVCFDLKKGILIGEDLATTVVIEGIAGFSQILKEEIIIAPQEGPRHPRTSIGVDKSGFILWLVLVDGRQKEYSEGMTTYELGKIMQELGCWHAVNMDGGGSSIMGLVGPDGQLDIVNSPSDRYQGKPKIRPLPMILTIRKQLD